MRVYIITQQDLKEGKSSIYDIYLNKQRAKRIVDKLNQRDNPSIDEDEGYFYSLESKDVDESNEVEDI